jgi:hypothetical protein
MPVRQQRQVSTKAVTRAGYNCSTPEAVTFVPHRLYITRGDERIASGRDSSPNGSLG